MAQLFFDQINDLSRRIADLDAQIAAASKRSRFSARLQKMPGIGPITSMALAAFAPPMETFRQARNFSAWLGLVPRQHSSGSKPRLGRTSKSGQRDIRRLLVIGAMAVIRWAGRKGNVLNAWASDPSGGY
jgi:transposase